MFSALHGYLRESGRSLEGLRSDALAGITVGVIALPLSMALAIAAGVPPQHGLYTAIVGGILIARAAGVLLAHFTKLGKVEVGYGILFVVCGSAYLIAWVIMHLLVPKFKKIVL